MTRKLVAVFALCLVAGCAAQLEPEDIQAFVNQVSNKVGEVKMVSPPEATAMLEQIQLSINEMANQMWGIEWAESSQGSWDLFVQLANSLTQQITQIKDMVPENSGNTWGSIYPREDLLSVAATICQQVSSMQQAAQDKFNVLLTITTLSACDTIKPTAASPAPAPAAARRLLA